MIVVKDFVNPQTLKLKFEPSDKKVKSTTGEYCPTACILWATLKRLIYSLKIYNHAISDEVCLKEELSQILPSFLVVVYSLCSVVLGGFCNAHALIKERIF